MTEKMFKEYFADKLKNAEVFVFKNGTGKMMETENEYIKDGQYEIVDCVEGCLLDNYLFENNNGRTMLFIEVYQNTWVSDHLAVEFDMKHRDEAWALWEEAFPERDEPEA